MSQVGIALTAIMMLLLVAFMAPNILAMNRGKILRNIAIWLAIFVGLGMAYKAMHPNGAPSLIQAAPQPAAQKAPAAHDNNDGNQGFTPPKEE